MLGWFWRIVVGRFSSCNHEWKVISKHGLREYGNIVGVRYVLQCSKCGTIKKKDVC